MHHFPRWTRNPPPAPGARGPNPRSQFLSAASEDGEGGVKSASSGGHRAAPSHCHCSYAQSKWHGKPGCLQQRDARNPRDQHTSIHVSFGASTHLIGTQTEICRSSSSCVSPAQHHLKRKRTSSLSVSQCGQTRSAMSFLILAAGHAKSALLLQLQFSAGNC